MSRDPYRSSTGSLGRSERWDRDRFYYERDRDRYGDVREEVDEEDDHVYTRSGPPRRGPVPVRRAYDDDDVVIRDDRRVYYEKDDAPRYRRYSPPIESDVDRRVVVDREKIYARSPSPPRRRYAPSPSPPRRRPDVLLRRPSSLDSFDRRPRGYYEREEYPPPARRDDFRPPPYVPIPLPRTKGLPPPRRPGDYFDEIRESDYYVEEDVRAPERVREKEVYRSRRRDRSRESRSTRSRARSRSTSSDSSSSGGGTSVLSEYPKKGKTRIPARLVSKRALVDLQYPFIEEGNTIVVQRALGQENIDDLLKLSEDYKKSDLEIASARSHTDEVIRERHEQVIVNPPAAAAPVEVVDTSTAIVRRAASPARTVPVVVEARPSTDIISTDDTVAIIEAPRHHHHRRRSRHRSSSARRDIIRAQRLPNGELVLFEEEIETVERPSRGVRIEKDKKGPPPGLMKAMLAAIT